jgi:RNA polymerase sigma factor (sigma-70 family)
MRLQQALPRLPLRGDFFLEAMVPLRPIAERLDVLGASLPTSGGPERRGRGAEARALLAQVGLTAAQFTAAWQTLQAACASYCEARAAIVDANLRLVVAIAKRYLSPQRNLLDLCQAGNFGLMRAVERFDPRRGYRFSTYATFWIRQSITRELVDTAAMIRVPMHMVQAQAAVRRAERRLEPAASGPAALTALAEATGLSPQTLRATRALPPAPLSLDAPFRDDEHNTLLDCLVDTRESSPLANAEDAMMTARVQDAVNRLPDPYRTILRRRFGLDGDEAQTLDGIAHRLGVTREWVRKLEAKALTRLRPVLRSRGLS